MNVLILGNGKGSWTMRGQQLGAALGARVTSAPTAEDCAWADVIVLVKRGILQFGRLAARAGKPIVWDALDCWAQPAQNALTPPIAEAVVRQMAHQAKPSLILGATEAMARAVDGVCLPHHSWAGLTPAPARAAVQTVAYQGGEVFLGHWRARLEQACAARGWRFVVNPADLREADLIVAFRDGVWDGWICREWKSGVKAVNAIAAGRPFISQDSAAVRELRPAGSIVETEAELEAAFNAWAPLLARVAVVEASRTVAPRFTVEAIAAQYREILQRVGVPCAAN